MHKKQVTDNIKQYILQFFNKMFASLEGNYPKTLVAFSLWFVELLTLVLKWNKRALIIWIKMAKLI